MGSTFDPFAKMKDFFFFFLRNCGAVAKVRKRELSSPYQFNPAGSQPLRG